MSAYNGVSLVRNVVPFLASLSATLLTSSPTWEGTHKYLDVISMILKNTEVQTRATQTAVTSKRLQPNTNFHA